MITRTIKLPSDLDARVRRRARADKLSFSEAARQALDSGLREDRGVNMLEAWGKFAGSVEGPSDLSTNKEYMQDFGRDRK